MTPPQPEQRRHETSLHGIKRNDPFAWMKAENWQEVMQDPSVLPEDIRAHLDAENDYTNSYFAEDQALQTKLFEELKGRIQEDESSVPQKDGSYHYFQKYETGQQYPQFYRIKRDTDFIDPELEEGLYEAAELIFDANKEAEGTEFFSLGGLVHSSDHKLLAVAVDTKGSEYFDLEIRRMRDGKVLDRLDQISSDFEWCENDKSIAYTRLDENHRPDSVHLHRIGKPVEDDTCLYTEKDPGFFVGIGKSESEDFLFIGTGQHDTNETYVLDAAKPQPVETPVRKRQSGIEYSLHHHGKTMLVLTNLPDPNADDAETEKQNAENFRIATAPTDDPSESNWRPLIQASPTNTIVSLSVYEDFMVRLERVHALPRIVITRFEDGEEHEIAFDEEAYSLGLSGGYEYKTSTIRFTYTSPTSPRQVFDYDMVSRERSLRKTQVIPSGHDASSYITKRFFAKAHDGAEIPVTLLAHKDTKLDGSAPTLLYGYGSYGMSMPAAFSSGIISLVDRGFVYAIGHVRGGSEMGQAWYKQGRAETKTNTFKDFISVAEDLINRNYSSKGEIAIHGGSAGGMLVGAAVNMRPDLFKAVVGQVPFVDVLTTMSDLSLPLTPIEWPEWGNPIEDEEAYHRIAAYSPVDQVEPQAYPAILAIGGLTDPRVTYWEPAKWVATLRLNTQSQAPILLKTNMGAGHGGASGRFDSLKETALIYTFLLKSFDKAKSQNLFNRTSDIAD